MSQWDYKERHDQDQLNKGQQTKLRRYSIQDKLFFPDIEFLDIRTLELYCTPTAAAAPEFYWHLIFP